MVKILIDVDLNKLTDEELQVYLNLKKKSHDSVKMETKKEEQPDLDELEERIVDKKKTRGEHVPGSVQESWFEQIQKLKEEKKISFQKAFKRITKRKANTWWNRKYIEFCKKRNLNPNLKGISFKSDKRKEPGYMLRNSPYLQWKNEHVARVMKYNKMNIYEATAYLGGIWSKSGKNPTQATEELEKIQGEFEKVQHKEEFVVPAVSGAKTLFPLLKHMTTDTTKILVSMVKHIVDDKTQMLSFNMEGKMLGLDSINKWHEFTEDFMLQQKEIKLGIGIGGDFVLTGITGVVAIKWEG